MIRVHLNHDKEGLLGQLPDLVVPVPLNAFSSENLLELILERDQARSKEEPKNKQFAGELRLHWASRAKLLSCSGSDFNGVPIKDLEKIAKMLPRHKSLKEIGIEGDSIVILEEGGGSEKGWDFSSANPEDQKEPLHSTESPVIQEEKDPIDPIVVNGKCKSCEKHNEIKVSCICQEASYCSELCMQNDKKFHKLLCKGQNEESNGNKQQEKLKEEPALVETVLSNKGRTGLVNIGNTCFMNSGIQCLSNTKELTEYFLSDSYIKEINEDNPIGTKGRLVRSYADMIKHLWWGSASSFTPSSFKNELGEANPMVFSHLAISLDFQLTNSESFRFFH